MAELVKRAKGRTEAGGGLAASHPAPMRARGQRVRRAR